MGKPAPLISADPGLSWSQLRAFEASARLRGFTTAAAALGLTASAVRYQVSLLEDRIGARLFDRNDGRLELTRAGAVFAQRIGPPLHELWAACTQARDVAEAESLVLTASPLFARQFLFDPGFLGWCEDHGVRLDVSDTKRDLFGRSPIVAIRMDSSHDPGLTIIDLLEVSLVIAAAPTIAASARPEDPSWWSSQTVIQTPISDAAWSRVWSALTLAEVSPRRAHRFSTYAVALEAATLGRGVILAPLPFANAELKSGQLMQISRVQIPSKSAFSLVIKEDLARTPRARALRRKLLSVIASVGNRPA
jgi:LysR family glycine cleavage system transcriptional activator